MSVFQTKNKALREVLGFFLFFALLFSAQAEPLHETLRLEASYKLEEEALSTEKIWTLEKPFPKNPQLKNWILVHKVSLIGLESKLISKKEKSKIYALQAALIRSESTGWLRDEGPWFFSMNDWPCDAKKLETNFFLHKFSSPLGAAEALRVASEQWIQQLRINKILLERALSKIKDQSPEIALEKGQESFAHWLKLEILKQENPNQKSLVRTQELDFYKEEAKRLNVCSLAKEVAKTKNEEQKQNAQKEDEFPDYQSSQARIPVKRWDGFFSIRGNLRLGHTTANGRFLVDFKAPVSSVSPSWLDAQGITRSPTQTKQQGGRPALQKVFWSFGPLNGALTEMQKVDEFELAGFNTYLESFALLETTDSFSGENYLGTCCDGVLGLDFLRQFVIEFRSTPQAEMLIWPREHFHGLAKQKAWISIFEQEITKNAQSLVRLENAPIENVQTENWTLDLPHGRIWYNKQEGFHLNTKVAKKNGETPSGLQVGYKVRSGERMLYLKSIRPQSPAFFIRDENLKYGSIISSIQGMDPSLLDLWQVHQILEGKQGALIHFTSKEKEYSFSLKK